MQPYSLCELLESFQKHSDSIALYLPRTSDLRQLSRQPTTDSKITVIHYCMEGASKVSYRIQYLAVPVDGIAILRLLQALCAYVGDFKFA